MMSVFLYLNVPICEMGHPSVAVVVVVSFHTTHIVFASVILAGHLHAKGFFDFQIRSLFSAILELLAFVLN